MALYSAGTVSLNAGAPRALVGAGTNFVGPAAAGYLIRLPDGSLYEIESVTDATHLTLVRDYRGATFAGQSYEIVPMGAALAAKFAASAQDLLGSFADVRDGPGQGIFSGGTVGAPTLRAATDTNTGVNFEGGDALSLVAGGSRVVRVGAGVVGINCAPVATIPLRIQTAGSNSGFEVQIDGGGPFLLAYDRNGATYQSMNYGASAHVWGINGASKLTLDSSGTLKPSTDNANPLGGGSNRFTVVYAVTGTINTSDATQKRWRGGLSTAELRAATRIAGEIGVFQWRDALAEKGEAARLHVGVRAQAVRDILIDEGLHEAGSTDSRYAFLCYDAWPETRVIVPPVFRPSALLDEHERPLPPVLVEPERVVVTPSGESWGIRPDQVAFFCLAAMASRLLALETNVGGSS